MKFIQLFRTLNADGPERTIYVNVDAIEAITTSDYDEELTVVTVFGKNGYPLGFSPFPSDLRNETSSTTDARLLAWLMSCEIVGDRREFLVPRSYA